MEMLDVVDENDNVIGKAEYADVYKKQLSHRIVHILLFNERNEYIAELLSKNLMIVKWNM